MLIFLQLYLAHLLADFLFQPNSIARNKRDPKRLAQHSAIHAATALVVVNVGLNLRVTVAIILLSVIHSVFDYLKARFTKDDWLAFTFDQFCHLLAIAGVSAGLAAGYSSAATSALTVLREPRLYLFLAAYVGVVFGGGYFVQKVTGFFMERIEAEITPLKPGLPSAGKYIGWLERFLVLTMMATGYMEGIGFLLAAKALVRYPEIKEDTKGHFAEYFLVGTLTSVGLAIVGGILLVKSRLWTI